MDPSELPISTESRALIETSISNYGRYARVRLSVDTIVQGLSGRFAFCTMEQEAGNTNVPPLTAEQLLERAETALEPLDREGFTPLISVRPLAGPPPKHRFLRPLGDVHQVLRMVPPRVLVHLHPGTERRLVAVEEPTQEEAELVKKAYEWARRAPFREKPGG